MSKDHVKFTPKIEPKNLSDSSQRELYLLSQTLMQSLWLICSRSTKLISRKCLDIINDCKCDLASSESVKCKPNSLQL